MHFPFISYSFHIYTNYNVFQLNLPLTYLYSFTVNIFYSWYKYLVLRNNILHTRGRWQNINAKIMTKKMTAKRSSVARRVSLLLLPLLWPFPITSNINVGLLSPWLACWFLKWNEKYRGFFIEQKIYPDTPPLQYIADFR